MSTSISGGFYTLGSIFCSRFCDKLGEKISWLPRQCWKTLNYRHSASWLIADIIHVVGCYPVWFSTVAQDTVNNIFVNLLLHCRRMSCFRNPSLPVNKIIPLFCVVLIMYWFHTLLRKGNKRDATARRGWKKMLNRQVYLSTSTKYDFFNKQYLYLIVAWNRLVQQV